MTIKEGYLTNQDDDYKDELDDWEHVYCESRRPANGTEYYHWWRIVYARCILPMGHKGQHLADEDSVWVDEINKYYALAKSKGLVCKGSSERPLSDRDNPDIAWYCAESDVFFASYNEIEQGKPCPHCKS